MKSYNILKNRIFFKKYKLIKIIGKGNFGYVFKGVNIQDKSEIAIKVEKKSSIYHYLETECNFLSILKGYGIPEVKSYGYSNNFYLLVEELLGNNLVEIYNLRRSLSLKDVIMIAIQAIDRLEFIHSKYVIHRDVKPENFLTGYENKSIIYLIDFGMAKKYKSSRTGKHLKFSLTGKLFGTFKYLSYNASRGVEQSRRDDLESLGYMLVFLKNGSLPWNRLDLKGSRVKTKYYHFLDLKRSITPENLCQNLPQEFAHYVKYCRNLGFEEDPNYNYLRNLFKGLLVKMKEINDSNFTWNKKLFFFWNKNSREDKRKYHNLLRRKESSRSRLFKSIKASFNSEEKNRNKLKMQKDSFFEESNNSHYKKRSENLLDIKFKNKLDESDYSSLDNISFNSNCAQYNLKLSIFQDRDKTDKNNYNQKNNSINKINIKKDNTSNNFESINIRKIYNLKNNNKRKINHENTKNNKNLKIIINQNLSNSSSIMTNNSKNNISNNNNKLSEVNSFNKKIFANKMNNIKYKFIKKSLTNSYKKGEIILYKPNLYKSKFNKSPFYSQRNNSKNNIIKNMKCSEYKPIYSNTEKSEFLYNIKDNSERQINKSQSYMKLNLSKGLNNTNNSENIMNIINKKGKEPLHYKNSTNSIFKKNNNYTNISEDIWSSNSGQKFEHIYKSVFSKSDNNEINFGLKTQRNFWLNKLFERKNDIKKLDVLRSYDDN